MALRQNIKKYIYTLNVSVGKYSSATVTALRLTEWRPLGIITDNDWAGETWRSAVCVVKFLKKEFT